ncbi:MAG: LacI family DNA-binding transcriptional regulator [Victivallaceae bacterium]|nr:LacI family DNA-binding transcriptional regulator [Victivallaceae bacterium]
MAVTIKKIAQELGLSPATVSLALNDSKLVAESTREKVKAVAAELDYVPNNFGRGLQSRHSRLIGCMCNSLPNNFNAEVVEAAVVEASERGYSVLMGVAGSNLDKFEQQFRLFLEKNVDGILFKHNGVFDGAMFPDAMRKIKQRKLPVIMIETDTVNAEFAAVGTDNFKGGYLAAEHLIKLGHRNIMCPMISYPFGRLEGYLAAFRDYGLPEPLRYTTYEAMIDVLRKQRGITAVIASCDFHAIGEIANMRKAGIRIPEDVSVIGFDDVWYASLPAFDLTTVAQQRSALGKVAGASLIDIIEGREVPAQQQLAPELVVRGSTAAPRSKSKK